MTLAAMYRAMAAYIKRHGYSPLFIAAGNGDPECGCFVHAMREVDPAAAIRWDQLSGHSSGPLGPMGELAHVLGVRNFAADTLTRAGWDAFAQDDAVAACLIAADLSEPPHA